MVRQPKKTEYGARDISPCPKCGSIVSVSRRSPHPTMGAYEAQTLSCTGCDYQEQRFIGPDGNIVSG